MSAAMLQVEDSRMNEFVKTQNTAIDKRFHVSFSGPEAEDREEIERFIYNSFKLAYGAHVHHFMPQLMSLRDAQGELLGACGLRSAGAEKLFLEAYLDAPIDSILTGLAMHPVQRNDIVEVGNLAGFRPGMARHLIAVLTAHLHEIGVHWVAFTAIPGLRNAFAKLGIEIFPICKAEKTRLPHECQAGWGSYYGQNPHVMVGSVPENYPLLLDNLRLLEPLP
jgi:hypothetical protein